MKNVRQINIYACITSMNISKLQESNKAVEEEEQIRASSRRSEEEEEEEQEV